MMPILLADCNNFYVSCERVFDPKLRRRPVRMYDDERGQRLRRVSVAVDAINRKHGRDTVTFAAGLSHGRQPRSDRRSPRYTTRWDELLTIT